jgi:hypothetical protein
VYRMPCSARIIPQLCNFNKDQYKPPEDGPKGTETCRGEYIDVLTVNFSISLDYLRR